MSSHPLPPAPDEAPASSGIMHVLCDLDGCLVAGERWLPGARAFVAAMGERLWIVSNNSTDTPESLSRRLGLELPPERWVLAGAETVRAVAAEQPGARVRVCAATPLQQAARAAGLVVCDEAPRTVLLCRDPDFTYGDLTAIVGDLEAGAELVVANPDLAHPGEHGAVPETGALLAAILAVRPGQNYRVFGKPAPDLFRIALSRASARAETAVMIGDNPDTDARGARAAGIAFRAVVPGAGLRELHEALLC